MAAALSPDTWTKSRVQALVTTNDKAAVRALLVVYSRQTKSEQASYSTEENNGVGFTGADAEILTSFVWSYKKYGSLTVKQMALLQKKIKKYWRQLLSEIESRGLPVTYSESK